jgi:hypothetical protein
LPAATTGSAPGTSAAGAEAPRATASAGGAAVAGLLPDCVPRRGTRPTRAPAIAHPCWC